MPIANLFAARKSKVVHVYNHETYFTGTYSECADWILKNGHPIYNILPVIA